MPIFPGIKTAFYVLHFFYFVYMTLSSLMKIKVKTSYLTDGLKWYSITLEIYFAGIFKFTETG
jgi:hypothetical protein